MDIVSGWPPAVRAGQGTRFRDKGGGSGRYYLLFAVLVLYFNRVLCCRLKGSDKPFEADAKGG
jgi:hypothetical protein